MTSHGNAMSETTIGSFSMNHVRSSSTSLTDATTSLNSEDELSNVQIYTYLTQYEETLAQLVDSVDNFKPDINIAEQLIQVDKRLFQSVNSFTEYDKIDSELERLEKESKELDQRTKDILETLNHCYNDLNALPMLEQVEFEKETILNQRAKINSSVLLDYATKLAKFTKVPPTLDRGSTGPNNFIWPAEDALRRGMLAMASLHSKEVTKIPGEQEEEPEVKHPAASVEPKAEEQRSDLGSEQRPALHSESRNSYVFTENSSKEQEDDDDAMDLDLDLFNPDEF